MLEMRGCDRGSITTGSSVHNCHVERARRDIYLGVLCFFTRTFTLNTPVVYFLVLHKLAGKWTKIYNTCTTIVWLTKPLVLRHFHCRCGLCKVPAVVVYKSYEFDLSVFCLLEFLRFKPWSHWKILSAGTIVVFHTRKSVYICSWKFPQIHTGIFGQMVRALCLSLVAMHCGHHYWIFESWP